VSEKSPYILLFDCPCPRQLAPFLFVFLKRSGAILSSVYRGDDIEEQLNALGMPSQRQMWTGYMGHKPWADQCCRPGESTHELRSDGRAHPAPRGSKLPWWACGIDVDTQHHIAFLDVAARFGWHPSFVYNVDDSWTHINFKRPPLRHRIMAFFK
jgi:hypothetical protein